MNSVLKNILTWSILLVILVSVFILPSSNVLLASSSNMTGRYNLTNQSSDLVRIQATCSNWIGIAHEGGSENNTDVACLQRVLEKCQPFNVSLGYVLGSMTISIKGLTNEGACSLNVTHEIEMGENKMICIVPQGKMSAWTNWKRGDGNDALDEISDYCATKS